MPRFEIDVDPCDHITADAIGKPGQRVFYLQAYQDQRTITVIIEKAQLQSMAIGIEQFLSQVGEQNPELSEREETTAANERITLFVAFNYGGRAEIVDAARSFSGETEEEFRRHLYAPDMHDPDLLIRTSGERRI